MVHLSEKGKEQTPSVSGSKQKHQQSSSWQRGPAPPSLAGFKKVPGALGPAPADSNQSAKRLGICLGSISKINDPRPAQFLWLCCRRLSCRLVLRGASVDHLIVGYLILQFDE